MTVYLSIPTPYAPWGVKSVRFFPGSYSRSRSGARRFRLLYMGSSWTIYPRCSASTLLHDNSDKELRTMHENINTPKFPLQANEADRLDQDTPVVPEPEDKMSFPGQLPPDADIADAIDQRQSLPEGDDEDYPYDE